MTTAGQLRKKLGPIKARLNEASNHAKDFLLAEPRFEDESYFRQLQNSIISMEARLTSFNQPEAKLQEFSLNDNEAQAKLLE